MHRLIKQITHVVVQLPNFELELSALAVGIWTAVLPMLVYMSDSTPAGSDTAVQMHEPRIMQS